VGEQLLAAIEVSSAHLETGALVTVDPVGHRVTVLPISMGGAEVQAVNPPNLRMETRPLRRPLPWSWPQFGAPGCLAQHDFIALVVDDHESAVTGPGGVGGPLIGTWPTIVWVFP
jgi:hypothetical protein